MKEFIREGEALQNVKVFKIRCDNGGEYSENSFKMWCKKKGIVLHYTIPYSPRLNGRAERLNRTLLEKTRALIFDSGLNKEIWGEAAYVAAYLLNRSPTENLNVTPVEKWTGQKPNLSNLQIFGSVAHAKRLGYLKKLDTRSKKYVFVGYSLNGFRLWDEERKEIKICRDVVFTEPENQKTNLKVRLESDLDKENTENLEDDVEMPVNEENKMDASVGEGNDDNGTQEEEINFRKSRSGRKIKPPVRLQDYECDLEENRESAMLTYEQAIRSPEKDKWIQAIEEEKSSLSKNNTWTLVNRSEAKDQKVLTSKWVFRVKDSERYKARLVIRGFEQEYGIDYDETFSPVVNMNCLRILFALAANQCFAIKTFDIKTAFLYGQLQEKIYMEIPEGYEENKEQVCLLQKSLYGLKQAPLSWNKRFTEFLKLKGLVPLKTERCIFKSEISVLFLAIYVDDGIIFGNNEQQIDFLLKQLREEFEMTENNNPRSFLNIEIKRTEEYLQLHQTKYVNSILKMYGMENAKSLSTPMTDSVMQDVECENITLKSKYPYRETVGSLLYLTNKTRPDIQYSVNICSRSLQNPAQKDILTDKRIVRDLAEKIKEFVTQRTQTIGNLLHTVTVILQEM